MWIKQKPSILGKSGRINTNFLFKQDSIFVMDNHLCASWCWLQKIDTNKKYDFYHIDRHNDLLFPTPGIKEELELNKIDLQNISFAEYLNLNEKNNLNIEVKLFRWDNYILNFNEIYPNLFGERRFITKEYYECSEFIDSENKIEEFINEFHHWLEYSSNGCILNLDIDFFFSEDKGIYKLYSDELIKRVAKTIKQNIHKIDVLTIALSPECCGGWENSIKSFQILAKQLEIDIDL